MQKTFTEKQINHTFLLVHFTGSLTIRFHYKNALEQLDHHCWINKLSWFSWWPYCL